jgi:hypothetical protein
MEFSSCKTFVKSLLNKVDARPWGCLRCLLPQNMFLPQQLTHHLNSHKINS